MPDALFLDHREQIAALALSHRVPTIYVSTRPVEGDDQAVFDRVVANGEDDRYRSRRHLGGAGYRRLLPGTGG